MEYAHRILRPQVEEDGVHIAQQNEIAISPCVSNRTLWNRVVIDKVEE
jgi:hypothetical protein